MYIFIAPFSFFSFRARFPFTLCYIYADCFQSIANTFRLNRHSGVVGTTWKIPWRDNRNSRFRITTVTCAIDTEFYVSQCQHVHHPLVRSAPGIFSKSRLQFTRRLIEFRTRTHAHSILPLCGRLCGMWGCIIQTPPTDSTLSPPHYYHTLK